MKDDEVLKIMLEHYIRKRPTERISNSFFII